MITVSLTKLWFAKEPFIMDEALSLLNILGAPIMIVPSCTVPKRTMNIGYACSFRAMGPWVPIRKIAHHLKYFGADVHVMHIDSYPYRADEKHEQGKVWLQQHLASMQARYHHVDDYDLIRSITTTVSILQLDCIMIAPHSQSFWRNILHHGRTSALLRKNNMPVILFPEVAL